VLIVPVAELVLVAIFEALILRGILFRIAERSLGWLTGSTYGL